MLQHAASALGAACHLTGSQPNSDPLLVHCCILSGYQCLPTLHHIPCQSWWRLGALRGGEARAQERDQAVQKRAYKILAFICAARPDFARPRLAEVLAALQAGVTSALSAAKRHRLACLQVGPCAPQ